MKESSTNAWCDRLGIEVPRVEDFVGRKGIKLFHLVVIALLEHGRPMDLEEVTDRLCRTGADFGPRSILPSDSILRAWHGMEPVDRDFGGRFTLKLLSPRLEALILHLGLRSRELPNPLPDGGETSLSKEEVAAALSEHRAGVSLLRRTAAVLDAHGTPMSLEEVERVLASMTAERTPLHPSLRSRWRTTLLVQDEHGCLSIDPLSPDLARMRLQIRRLARPVLERRAREEHTARRVEAVLARQAREKIETMTLRRALVHPMWIRNDPGGPRAIAVLDPDARSIRVFAGDEVASAADELCRFDVLVGVHIAYTLCAMELDSERWRTIDLKSPRKRVRIGPGRRTARIMTWHLIWSTTGIEHAFSGGHETLRYLEEGKLRQLALRLEIDATLPLRHAARLRAVELVRRPQVPGRLGASL